MEGWKKDSRVKKTKQKKQSEGWSGVSRDGSREGGGEGSERDVTAQRGQGTDGYSSGHHPPSAPLSAASSSPPLMDRCRTDNDLPHLPLTLYVDTGHWSGWVGGWVERESERFHMYFSTCCKVQLAAVLDQYLFTSSENVPQS